MNAVSLEAQVSRDHQLQVTLPDDFPPGTVKVTIEFVSTAQPNTPSQRSTLGRTLEALRSQALTEGLNTSSQDEILAEVRRRRGEPADDG